ncbi:MAG: InlB B-repeat-containing protein, partial [Clostridiales bacterium]|nr:InlB B-repeat-containing protein [Clostridiales bacterium]
MAKRLLKTMILPLTVLATALAFIACDGTAPDVKYKVTYVIGADAQGTAPTETDKAFGEKFKLKSADGITYDGMEFTGWSDGNITYQAGDTYTMPSKAVTFTAQWESLVPPATYSVTYDLNGGTGETPSESYKGASETFTLALADGFSYEGKEFDGWSDGTDKYDAGAEYTMSGKAVVFTAQWKDAAAQPEQIYVNMELDYAGYIYLYDNGTGMFDYVDADDNTQEVQFTYTLDGTAIAIKVGSNTFNGTYDGDMLTVEITYKSTLFKYGPKQELPTGKPTVTFNANGGTGTAPVIADADIVVTTNNQYNITLPQCTYTAPANKEFDKWEVISGNKSFGNYAAGSTFKANAGENLTLKAVWKDAQSEAPAGVVLYGNCTLPTKKGIGGMTQGGETVVQIVIDTTDAQNVKIKYMLADDVVYSNDKTGDGTAYAQYMPDVYGDDALYCGAYQIGDLKYNIVVKPDLTALYLCDTDDELLDDGEFTTTPPQVATYTVTYTNPNGATGELPEAVTVNEGTQVTLAAATQFTKAGWTFKGWQVTGYSALRAANTKITVTEETTITPVFGINYTDPDDKAYGTVTVLDNDTVIIVDYGYTYDYTRNGDIVVIDLGEGYLVTVKVNDATKTYVELDGLQDVTFTAANNATLTFDGLGTATLGTNTLPYEY